MNVQFVETIKIQDGRACALPYHQERMRHTLLHICPHMAQEQMPQLESILAPDDDMHLYKARVVYSGRGIDDVQYQPYHMRSIHSLRAVTDDNISYPFKSTDRSRLDALRKMRDGCDDIVIIKHGLVTDTSFTNIAMYDGHRWLTPEHPLLPGCKRASLLHQGVIHPAPITLEMLRQAESIMLFNAMIEFGECHPAIII